MSERSEFIHEHGCIRGAAAARRCADAERAEVAYGVREAHR